MLFDPKWEVKADNEVVTALRRAMEIIADESKWTCGSYALSRQGHEIDPLTPGAVSFCSIGALALAMNSRVCEVEVAAPCHFLCAAASEKNHAHAINLNDKGRYAAALWMFDRAIELAAAAT